MDELQLVVEGAPIVLHPLWLRDHCACPSCLDPSSGQRVHPPGGWLAPARERAVTVAEYAYAGATGLTVTWADGHVSSYANRWLARFGPRRRASSPMSRASRASGLEPETARPRLAGSQRDISL